MKPNHREIQRSRECGASYKHNQKEFKRCFGPARFDVKVKHNGHEKVYEFKPI